MPTLPPTLIQLLNKKGKIPFVEFMHEALYAPEFGYYTTNAPQLGKEGDFTTAPEQSCLFGHTLALQCKTILANCYDPVIFEFGAGTGKLCIDILQKLDQLQSLPKFYYILEVSGALQKQQFTSIQEQIPHLLPRVRWLKEWPQESFSGVILANEVLDAMPVHRFLLYEQKIFESFITLASTNTEKTNFPFTNYTTEELTEVFNPSCDERLLSFVEKNLDLKLSPFLSEVNLFLPSWINQCYAMLKTGVVIIIDYGFSRAQYYHPDRNQGTLMCHFQHKTHTNPLLHVGAQDITAHVDFTSVAEEACNAGFDIAGFTNQASFLIAGGILQLLENINVEKKRIIETQAVKKLLEPQEMGELFKVIALGKNFDNKLEGFSLYNKLGSL